MYIVTIFNLLGMAVDTRNFEFGTWQEIGFWLDHYGYNCDSFRLEIRFSA